MSPLKQKFQKLITPLLIVFLAIVIISIISGAGSPNKQNQLQPIQNVTEYTGSTDTPQAHKTKLDAEAQEVTIYKRETGNSKNTPSTENTTENETTDETEVTFATAETQESTASYQAQWNKGYLLALDYPDRNYSCRHVELSDENRDLIEKVCMAEFGSGGFTGAALIAQSIKNAMVYYGTDNVNSILGKLHYTGRKSTSVSKDVRDAVVFIFDMDKNAVQHRILYKYNPETRGSLSEFHESKEYVCTYRNARFFDE